MRAEFLFNHHSSVEYNTICGYFDAPSENVSGGVQTDLNTESNYNGSHFFIVSNNYNEPISFELSVVRNYCSGGDIFFSQEEVRAIVKWLCNPIDYCDFQIKDDMHNNITYRAKFTKPQYHTHGEQIIGMTFTCTFDRPYGLSSEARIYDFSMNSSRNQFMVFNSSDETTKCLYPQSVVITVRQAGTVSLRNMAEDEHMAMTFTDCIAGEVITIDCEHKRIKSSDTSKSILSKFNKHWLRLVIGENIFKTTGSFDVSIEYKEVRKVGAW